MLSILSLALAQEYFYTNCLPMKQTYQHLGCCSSDVGEVASRMPPGLFLGNSISTPLDHPNVSSYVFFAHNQIAHKLEKDDGTDVTHLLTRMPIYNKALGMRVFFNTVTNEPLRYQNLASVELGAFDIVEETFEPALVKPFDMAYPPDRDPSTGNFSGKWFLPTFRMNSTKVAQILHFGFQIADDRRSLKLDLRSQLPGGKNAGNPYKGYILFENVVFIPDSVLPARPVSDGDGDELSNFLAGVTSATYSDTFDALRDANYTEGDATTLATMQSISFAQLAGVLLITNVAAGTPQQAAIQAISTQILPTLGAQMGAAPTQVPPQDPIQDVLVPALTAAAGAAPAGAFSQVAALTGFAQVAAVFGFVF